MLDLSTQYTLAAFGVASGLLLTPAASAQGFSEGDLYLIANDYPGAFGGSALVRIDPTTGDKTVLADDTVWVQSGIQIGQAVRPFTYDPATDRLVLPTNLPPRTLFFVDSTGTETEELYYGGIGSLLDVPATSLAPTCDGRIYIYGGRYLGFVNADHASGGIVTTDGTTRFELTLGGQSYASMYDATTHSIFLVHPGGSSTIVTKVPLSADGTQVSGPVESTTYDAGYTFGGSPTAISRGPSIDQNGAPFPNGSLFVKIDVNEDPRNGVLMFLVDPVTLDVTPYALGDASSAGSTVATYNSVHGWAAALDTFGTNAVRIWEYDPTSEGAPTVLADGCSTTFGSHEAAGLLTIGDTIGGLCTTPNLAPSITGDAGPFLVDVGVPFELVLTVDDPEGELVTIDDSGLLAGMTATPSGGTGAFDLTISWTPTAAADVGAPQGVCLTGTDPQGATAEFCFTIADVNQPPVADAGSDLSTDEGLAVQLDGSASSDPDGDGVDLFWAQVAGDPVVLDTTDPVRPTFTAPTVDPGGAILTFELLAFDGRLVSAPDFVNVTVVNVNHPPLADAGADQTVQESTVVELDGTDSFDGDGEPLTYDWMQLSGPTVSLVDVEPGIAMFLAPEVTSTVALEFLLTVDDGLDVDVDVVVVTVENVNHPPTADAGDTQAVDEGTLVQLDGSDSSDPDNDDLTFSWAQIAGTTVALDTTDPARPTFTAPDVASTEELRFELVVSDGLLSSTPSTVAVVVLESSSPPRCDLAEARSVLPNGELSDDNVMWPPNHTMRRIEIIGVADPAGLDVTLTIDRVTQDEPLNGAGDGNTDEDALVNPDGVLLLRSERAGGGDGRVYVVEFTATNAAGDTCQGEVRIVVPHSRRSTAVDSGQNHVSWE